MACTICGVEIPAGNRFCQQCGGATEVARPGFTLARASEWREAFQGMGWWEEPPLADYAVLQRLLKAAGAITDQSIEPWLFMTRVKNSNWSITEFKIDDQRVAMSESKPGNKWAVVGALAGGMVVGSAIYLATRNMRTPDTNTWIVGTRERLLIASVTKKEFVQWMYRELNDGSADRKGNFYLTSDSGESVAFRVRVNGTRLARMANYAIVTALTDAQTPHHAVIYDRAQSRQDAKDYANMDFMAAIGQFINEVIQVDSAPSTVLTGAGRSATTGVVSATTTMVTRHGALPPPANEAASPPPPEKAPSAPQPHRDPFKR